MIDVMEQHHEQLDEERELVEKDAITNSFKEFEDNYDMYYDKYRDISNKRGFFGEIKFVISYGVVWIYVIIE